MYGNNVCDAGLVYCANECTKLFSNAEICVLKYIALKRIKTRFSYSDCVSYLSFK